MEKLEIDSLTDYKFLSGLKYSPDGSKACFVVREAELEENNYTSQLWIYNLEQDELYRLTTGERDGSFVWLDNKSILFTANRKDNDDDKVKSETEFYRININGGEAEYVTSVSLSVNNFKKGNDDKIYFTGITDLKDRDEEELKEEKDYEVLEEIPYWANGQGFTNKQRTHLYSLDLAEKEVEQLIEGNYDIIDFDIADNKICLNMNCFEDKMSVRSELYLYELKKDSLEQLTEEDMSISYLQFINSEKIYFAASDMEAMGLNTNNDIFQYNLEEKEVKAVTENLDKSLWASVGNDCRMGAGKSHAVDGEQFYFLTTEGYNTYLNVIGENGPERVIENEGTVDMFDVNKGKILFIGFRDNKLQELYLYNEGEERQVSQFNEDVLADKMLSTPEYFEVTTSDGCELDAWVMKPVGYQEGREYPTIMEIHGGPKTAYGTIFFHEFQVLANQGYAIVFTNPRGSDGKGNEFADIRGGYGDRDYQDLMETMDTALDKFDFIDEDRLGVGGGSYGGYMTNWVIGHTDRFKAAVSQRSISNWISMFGTTDIGFYFVEDQFKGATPWSDFEKLWDGSPMKYADRVNTPTLFIHSEQDYRCWLTEGLQMFTALKFHDVDSRLCMFKGENHELSRSGKPKHRIRRLQEMVDWFDKYLKDEE